MKNISNNIIGIFLGFAYFIVIILGSVAGIIRIVKDFNFESGLNNFCAFMIALVILPITVLAGPWFAIIKFGDWLPLLLIYGGGFSSIIIIGFAHLFIKEKEPEMPGFL